MISRVTEDAISTFQKMQEQDQINDWVKEIVDKQPTLIKATQDVISNGATTAVAVMTALALLYIQEEIDGLNELAD